MMPFLIVFGHAGSYRFPVSYLRQVCRDSIDLLHEFFAPEIILSGQYSYKLISAYTEHRTVTESTADLSTGIFYARIALSVSVEIIYGLKIIYVADNQRKRLLLSIFDLSINYSLPLLISVLVLYACKGIDICLFPGS